MPILTQPAFGPKVALAYVTVGSLIDVWTGVWYWTRDYELSRTQQFWIVGLALTGLTFVLLGLLLGPLGRSARKAELPPAEATPAEATIQQTAAAQGAAPVAPVAPMTVAGTPAAVAPAAPVAPPAGAVMPPQRPIIRTS